MRLGHHHPNRPLAAGGGRRRRSERGASLVEYALLLSLLAVVAYSAVSFLGTATASNIDQSRECIEAARAGEVGPDCS